MANSVEIACLDDQIYDLHSNTFMGEHIVHKRFDTNRSFIFSVIFVVLSILWLRLSIAGIFGTFLVIPIALILFNKWLTGALMKTLPILSIRSIFLFAIILAISISFVKLFGAGQVGYGPELQINGKQITSLGYIEISKTSFGWAGIAWLSALAVAVKSNHS